MTKTHAGIGIAIAFLFAFFAATVYADGRTSLRGGISIAPPSSPSPVVPFVPSTPAGISNTTSGAVSSGGNTGGNVTTGDEEVEVHVRNEGPTNSNTVITDIEAEEPPVQAPSCRQTRTTRCEDTSRR